MKKKHNRREFIKLAGFASLGLSTPFVSAFNLKAVQAAANDNTSATNDYKALVCLFLAGGNDSFNMVIPSGSDEYNEYAITRSDMAIPQNEIIPLDINTGGKAF